MLHHVYGGNAVVLRTVESNDGTTVVERRTFERVATAKILTTVESLRFELGGFGDLAATLVDSVMPGTSDTITTVAPVAQYLLGQGYQQKLNENNARVKAQVDSLSGKTVRITYRDGEGVIDLEPIDCTLSDDEVGFLYATSVFSDCHIMPDEMDIGDEWTVSGRELAMMLDPSWRALPSGDLDAVRLADKNAPGDETYAVVEVSGSLDLDDSSDTTERIGTFTLARDGGEMEVSQTEGHVVRGVLRGTGTIRVQSKDHILFVARFRSQPDLIFEYRCELLD